MLLWCFLIFKFCSHGDTKSLDVEGHYFKVYLAPGKSIKTIRGKCGDHVKPRSAKSQTVSCRFLMSVLEFKAVMLTHL